MATSPISPVPSAADQVSAAITAAVSADGPLRFDRFMELALYGDGGFYTTGGRAGRRHGDFITSPEVGPLFGAVLACWIEAEYRRLNEPAGFTVIEVGAGPGTLARTIRAAGRVDFGPPDRHDSTGHRSLRYVAVELSAEQRVAHPDWVVSAQELPDVAHEGPPAGVIIANELLDNLPFRLLVFDGSWREAHVDVDRSGRLVEVLSGVIDPHPVWLPATATHGARVPWQQAAADWVAEASGWLREGSVVAFDYATPTTAELASMPWRAWLRTYRAHGRGSHYLSDPGEQDITTQVALDQLPEPDAVWSQAEFLQRWGIADLVEEGRREWAAAAAAPTVAAMRMRSRISEADALLDPAGLGGFTALEWRVV
jgi:SAM-dependent MidA family methyltransferase